MPTQSTTYNTRLTDEALEKRFRDTFRSQGGAELVDDLYASGVIVPVVDFTQAAEGSQLPTMLQTAWDFTTGSAQRSAAGTTSLISTAGFWRVDVSASGFATAGSGGGIFSSFIRINDGATTKPVWGLSSQVVSPVVGNFAFESDFIVFLRSGDTLELHNTNTGVYVIDVWYRQVADVSGNLVNPSGFTSS